jgi:DNA-binding XRE family transcriptional regulator
MDELAELLGIDYSDPVQRLARDLTENDYALIGSLVEIRKAKGLTRADVAERMGTTVAAVGDLETVSSDPRMSILRRYAMAVGALMTTTVAPVHIDAAA